MSHTNATLTPAGRLRLAQFVIDKGWSYARAADGSMAWAPPSHRIWGNGSRYGHAR